MYLDIHWNWGQRTLVFVCLFVCLFVYISFYLCFILLLFMVKLYNIIVLLIDDISHYRGQRINNPTVQWSDGSVVRMFIGLKVQWSKGALVRMFIILYTIFLFQEFMLYVNT
jgi:hypothetical protein